MLFAAIGGFVLLLVVAYLISRPLIVPRTTGPGGSRNGLAADKEKLLENIRELDLDFATGKLSEEDYRDLRSRSVAEAAEVMRAIDQARGPAPEDDDIERAISAKKAQMQDRTCSACGAARTEGAKFCATCGAPLPAIEVT